MSRSFPLLLSVLLVLGLAIPGTAIAAVNTPVVACPVSPGEVRVPGGRFAMGMDRVLPEESRPREVDVPSFFMDRTEVTNAQFAAFVKATGYRTQAERGWADRPQVPAALQAPGSVVFRAPSQPAAPADSWWVFTPGANWRHPEGPGSSIAQRLQHPVVHVTYDDALAYAHWAGRELPTEAQWERAARYGTAPTAMLEPPRKADGSFAANTFQGDFPRHNTAADGYVGTAPVGCFGANPLGLYDLLGNVWEWTRDSYAATGVATAEPARILKGGSYLCTEHFCARYRPAARQPGTEDLGTSHIGFRTVRPRRAAH